MGDLCLLLVLDSSAHSGMGLAVSVSLAACDLGNPDGMVQPVPGAGKRRLDTAWDSSWGLPACLPSCPGPTG